MFQGVTFPSMHVMLARWIPPSERSKFSAYVYAGKLQAKHAEGRAVRNLQWNFIFSLAQIDTFHCNVNVRYLRSSLKFFLYILIKTEFTGFCMC
jgi:sugar phosphate permease